MSDLRYIDSNDCRRLGSFSTVLVDDCSAMPPMAHTAAYVGDLLRRHLEVEARRGKTYRLFHPELPYDSSYVGLFRNAIVADHLCTLRTEEGLFVRESLPGGHYDEEMDRSSANGSGPFPTSEAGYLIGSWLAGNYYHWIFQALPSLDYLRRLGVEDARIVVGPVKPWQLRAMELAGVPTDRLDVLGQGEARKYERLYYPYYARGHYHGFRPGLREYFAAMRARARRSGSGELLLYASRRRMGLRPLLNEAALEDALAARGFTVICPETLSIDEQIDMFSRARVVVGPHGSQLTNLVFCDPGTIVYELNPIHHVRPGAYKVSQYFDLAYHGDCFKPFPKEGRHGWMVKLPRVLEHVDSILAQLGSSPRREATT